MATAILSRLLATAFPLRYATVALQLSQFWVVCAWPFLMQRERRQDLSGGVSFALKERKA
jgi:hypothetical protein